MSVHEEAALQIVLGDGRVIAKAPLSALRYDTDDGVPRVTAELAGCIEADGSVRECHEACANGLRDAGDTYYEAYAVYYDGNEAEARCLCRYGCYSAAEEYVYRSSHRPVAIIRWTPTVFKAEIGKGIDKALSVIEGHFPDIVHGNDLMNDLKKAGVMVPRIVTST